MSKIYRKGAIGALMDEYERAADELRNVIERTTGDDFLQIFDPETEDDDCRSIQSIMSHVVRACYGYANSIRGAFSVDAVVYEPRQLARDEVVDKLDEAIEYTVETLAGRWEIAEKEITAVVIKTRWGVTYDLEQMLEHAIVHILRHRRQIEKFLAAARPE